MSEPESWIQSSATLVRGYLGQWNAIVEKAARTDERGDWGIDPWVVLIHDLIDLQIRSTAQGVQVGLAGPWWLRPPNCQPPLSQDIPVAPAPYPRRLSVAESFDRIGHIGVTIPDAAVEFVPAVLPSGAGSFQMRVTDGSYVGANYTGKVGFCDASSGGDTTPRPPLPVTVGL